MKNSIVSSDNVLSLVAEERERNSAFARALAQPHRWNVVNTVTNDYRPRKKELRKASLRERYRFWCEEYKLPPAKIYDFYRSGINYQLYDKIYRHKNSAGRLSYRKSHNLLTFFSLPGHFLHLSNSNDGLVAYTENEDKMLRDIQTVTKFGKYLQKYHSDWLDPSDIQTITSYFMSRSVPKEMFIGTTREDFKMVYNCGNISSCMSNKPETHFVCHPVHPTEAYASGEFGIAYIKEDDRIVGRAVVDLVEKTYNRAYGNVNSMAQSLESNGYKLVTTIRSGAKLLQIPFKEYFVGPYIDLDSTVYKKKDDNEYLYLYGSFRGVSASDRNLLTEVGASDRSVDTGGLIGGPSDSRRCCYSCDARIALDAPVVTLFNHEAYRICSVCEPNYVMTEDHGRCRADSVVTTQDGRIFSCAESARRAGYRLVDGGWVIPNRPEPVRVDRIDDGARYASDWREGGILVSNHTISSASHNVVSVYREVVVADTPF